MNYIFKANFYTIYQAPNADELIDKINSYTEDSIDNGDFSWGNKSSSDKIPLKWEEYYDLLSPSIELFAEEFKVMFNYTFYDSVCSVAYKQPSVTLDMYTFHELTVKHE